MENLGEIYCLTSPSGKKYIGQCVKKLCSGRNWGYINRWKQHISEATRKKNCSRVLDAAIRKYSPDNFKLELIKECNIEEMNFYENYYITEFNTMKPHGYNLTTGGSVCRQSEETRERKRISGMGKNLGKRKDELDKTLPQYIYCKTKKGVKQGYAVQHHPKIKEKWFTSSNFSMEDKLQLALEYFKQETTADIR